MRAHGSCDQSRYLGIVVIPTSCVGELVKAAGTSDERSLVRGSRCETTTSGSVAVEHDFVLRGIGVVDEGDRGSPGRHGTETARKHGCCAFGSHAGCVVDLHGAEAAIEVVDHAAIDHENDLEGRAVGEAVG